MGNVGDIQFGLSISLLGPMIISGHDQRPIKFRSNRDKALLIYLSTERAMGSSIQRREGIMNLLWPDYTQKSAQTNLRQALYHLRKAVPEMSAAKGDKSILFLLTDRQTVQINPDYVIELDVFEFTRLLKGPREQWNQAVDLYRGDFLTDFYLSDSAPYEEWAVTKRASFRNQALKALGTLAMMKIEQKAYREAESYTRQQLEMDHLRESAYRQLMTIMAFTGQRSQALVLYDTCRQLLQTELGIEPSAETVAVHEAIRSEQLEILVDLTESHAKQLAPIEALEDTDRPPFHNLPPQPTPFIGREKELASLDALIADPEIRLINIVSPGGVGKTRLATAAAESQLEKERVFKDGVSFVSLAPVSSSDEIITTTADALQFKFEADGRQMRSPMQQLLDHLRPKQLLLIMDNFEHLLDGVSLLTEILHNAPGVQIIVTSRERLLLQQEQVYPIQGLEYQEEGKALLSVENITEYSAVNLFFQSARRIQPNFDLSANNVVHINQICKLVEGMPLALELAASWVNILSLSDITGEIQGGIDFLQSDVRDVPRRQRKMRAVFDSTWGRLTETERDIFTQISVFRGGCTRQAAQTITSASLPLLASLVNKSLLRYEKGDDRYYIHELLRQYAADKLAQHPSSEMQAGDRHSSYYCKWLSEREGNLRGARRTTTMTEIESEIDNIRAAWNWAVTHNGIEQIETGKDSLGFFYNFQGFYHLGVKAFQMAAKSLRDNPSAIKVLISLLTWHAVFENNLGHGDEANRLLQEALALLDSSMLVDQDVRSERAFVLLRIGILHLDSDREWAISLLQESLVLCRETGDQFQTANVLTYLGNLARGGGEYEKAREIHEEALAIHQKLGYQKGISTSLSELSSTLLFQGQYENGERLARESYAMAQEAGTWDDLMWGNLNLGIFCFLLGKFSEAHPLLVRAIEQAQQRGHKYGIAWGTTYLGMVLMHLGGYKEAHTTGQQGLRVHQEMGVRGFKELALSGLSWEALGMGSYGEAEQLAREALVGSRKLGDVWRENLSLVSLGFALLGLGKILESQRYFLEATQLSVKLGGHYPLIGLPGIALLLIEEGEAERAVELYALASRYPFVANSLWWHDAVGRHIEFRVTNWPEDVVEAAMARGRSLDLQQTAVDLFEELPARGWGTP